MRSSIAVLTILAVSTLASVNAAHSQVPTAERMRLAGAAKGYEQAYASSPSQAVAFLLADTYAQLEDRKATLRYLSLAADGPVEIMPPRLSQVWRYRTAPEFKAVFAKLQKRFVSTRNGVRIHRLGRGMGPFEGIAWNADQQSLFLGDMASRRIMTLTSDRQLQPFDPNLTLRPLGMAVDQNRRRLWAATSNLYAAIEPIRTELVLFDLTSGAKQSFTSPSAKTFNDVAIAPNGDVFVTDTEGGAVYVLRDGTDTLKALVPPGSLFLPNGVAVDETGAHIYVAQGASIVRVDTIDGRQLRLEKPASLSTVGTDGLYLHQGSLIGVQNVLTPGRIVRMRLNPSRTAILAADIIENGHPDFNTPTTAALDGDRLLVLANGQIPRLKWNGEVDEKIEPAIILCYDLRNPTASSRSPLCRR